MASLSSAPSAITRRRASTSVSPSVISAIRERRDRATSTFRIDAHERLLLVDDDLLLVHDDLLVVHADLLLVHGDLRASCRGGPGGRRPASTGARSRHTEQFLRFLPPARVASHRGYC
jgi:hypothetical protein